MSNQTAQEILNLIDKSKNILIFTHAKPDCDGLGASLSLYLALKELGKTATVISNDPAPENLDFLPAMKIIQNSLAASKDFIITLDLTKTPLNKVKYNLEDNHVNIIVTPKSGMFSKDDVSFTEGNNKYDLIFVLDAGNLEHLGPIYDQNTELFFESPVINIDHHTSNTDFGQINLVNPVAASTTEILFDVLKAMEKKYERKFVTDDIATLLLAGIITDTGSFQHANTSPQSMEVAAELLDLGGRQQEIIKNIYKTKKLTTLKLWGTVLSKVQVDPLYRMVWSTISKEDLRETGADANESEGIIDDLLSNAPGAEVISLIKFNPDGNYVSVSMRSTTDQVDVGKICAEMGGGGHIRAAGFKVRDGKPFDQVISDVLKTIRKYQSKRLNIHPEDKSPMGDPVVSKSAEPNSEGDDTHLRPEKGEVKPPEESKPDQPAKITYLDFDDKKEPNNKPKTQEFKPKEEKKEDNRHQKNNKRQRPPRNRKPKSPIVERKEEQSTKPKDVGAADLQTQERREAKPKPQFTPPKEKSEPYSFDKPKPQLEKTAPMEKPVIQPVEEPIIEKQPETKPTPIVEPAAPPVVEKKEEQPAETKDIGAADLQTHEKDEAKPTTPKEETPPPEVPDWLKS